MSFSRECNFHDFLFFKREIFMMRNFSYHSYIHIHNILCMTFVQSWKIHVAKIFTRQDANNSCARKKQALQYIPKPSWGKLLIHPKCLFPGEKIVLFSKKSLDFRYFSPCNNIADIAQFWKVRSTGYLHTQVKYNDQFITSCYSILDSEVILIVIDVNLNCIQIFLP